MVETLRILYKGYFIVGSPFLITAFLIGIKQASWQLKEFLLFFVVTPFWLVITLAHPDGKTLANYGLEPIFLGLGAGIIFLLTAIVSKGDRHLRFRLLCFLLILLVIIIHLAVPTLEEKDYTVLFPILKFLL